MNNRIPFSLILPLFLFTSCVNHPLQVQTLYVTKESHASFHVRTPDPALNRPLEGQKMIIRWSLPKNAAPPKNLSLLLRVRFRNQNEEKIVYELKGGSGQVTYSLLDRSFKEKGGISSYKLLLIGDERTLHTLDHQLWVERIELNSLNE